MTFEELAGNRTIVFKALTGSHNYNLNNENSDEDYKLFVLPTFEDLYDGKMFSNSMTSPTLDATVHDVRRLVGLLWKANLNFLEVLWSCKRENIYALEFLVDHRDEIAKMNEYAFFKASYGMHLQKMSSLYKGTETTAPMVAKIGYDPKDACHALRILYVLSKYAATRDMGESLWFDNGSVARERLMEIKNGEVPLTDFLKFIENWREGDKDYVETWFKATKPNSDWYEYAKKEVRQLIRESVRS